MYGEGVLIFNKELQDAAPFKHKQVMQLASKNRFIAAQFRVLLTSELWRKGANHANTMAQYLEEKINTIPHVLITKPVEANVVFAIIPKHWNDRLMELFPFYQWREDTNEVRLMCAHDTTKEEINQLANAMSKLTL